MGSKKKSKLKGEVGSINKYRAVESYDVPCEPCRPSKKEVKKRLKLQQEKLDAACDLLDGVEIVYEERQRVIGALYMSVWRTKRELSMY